MSDIEDEDDEFDEEELDTEPPELPSMELIFEYMMGQLAGMVDELETLSDQMDVLAVHKQRPDPDLVGYEIKRLEADSNRLYKLVRRELSRIRGISFEPPGANN